MTKSTFFRNRLIQMRWFMVCGLSVLALWGCASQGMSPSTQPELPPINAYTRNLLSQTIEKNQHILTARGKGWLTIKSRKIKSRFRIIWMTRMPHDLRITLLDAGHPVETLVTNGTQIHFFSHTGSHKPYTTDADSKDLRYFFPVDIPMDHIVRLFSGKIPIYDLPPTRSFLPEPGMEYSTAVITEDSNTKTNGRQNLEQRLIWDTRANIQQISISKKSELLNKSKKLYQTNFNQWMPTERYKIPSLMEISNPRGERLTIKITELEPNIPVSPSIFELTQ